MTTQITSDILSKFRKYENKTIIPWIAGTAGGAARQVVTNVFESVEKGAIKSNLMKNVLKSSQTHAAQCAMHHRIGETSILSKLKNADVITGLLSSYVAGRLEHVRKPIGAMKGSSHMKHLFRMQLSEVMETVIEEKIAQVLTNKQEEYLKGGYPIILLICGLSGGLAALAILPQENICEHANDMNITKVDAAKDLWNSGGLKAYMTDGGHIFLRTFLEKAAEGGTTEFVGNILNGRF